MLQEMAPRRPKMIWGVKLQWHLILRLALLAVLVQLAHLAALLATEPEPFRVRMPNWLIR